MRTCNHAFSPLGGVFLQFGSTSAYSNSAAAQPDADMVEYAVENVDTVGWGSTKVGTLLKAKVRRDMRVSE